MKFLAITMCVAVHGIDAQRATPAPIHGLLPGGARTMAPVRSVVGDVRQLADGRLLVNDAFARRLICYGPDLTTYVVLRDSVAGTATSYGPRASMVLPFVGDSLLFADVASKALIVIDPAGHFTRAVALPNTLDIDLITRPGVGIDGGGRLVYRGARQSDSVPILRADFEARTVDTIARVRTLVPDQRVVTGTGDQRHTETIVNPLQAIDEWTAVADGSIALVRGHDYHVDWINADGTRTSSAKILFDWRRLADADKQHLIDSARTAQQARDSIADARAKATGQGRTRILIQDGRDVVVPDNSSYSTSYVPLSEILDYYPPIRAGAVRADRDNNLWILPTTTAQSTNGELIYDVVNRKGELSERVRVPAGRSIAGFGRGGIVYLMWRDGANGWFIEQTRVQR